MTHSGYGLLQPPIPSSAPSSRIAANSYVIPTQEKALPQASRRSRSRLATPLEGNQGAGSPVGMPITPEPPASIATASAQALPTFADIL